MEPRVCSPGAKQERNQIDKKTDRPLESLSAVRGVIVTTRQQVAQFRQRRIKNCLSPQYQSIRAHQCRVCVNLVCQCVKCYTIMQVEPATLHDGGLGAALRLLARRDYGGRSILSGKAEFRVSDAGVGLGTAGDFGAGGWGHRGDSVDGAGAYADAVWEAGGECFVDGPSRRVSDGVRGQHGDWADGGGSSDAPGVPDVCVSYGEPRLLFAAASGGVSQTAE